MWPSRLSVRSNRTVVTSHKHDGDRCRPGESIAEVAASARTLLIGERTALNFLQRLSGIATSASRFVDAAGGRITVLDTRKTTPTLRALEKYAVRAGGATNHRVGLFDAVLIKDNHIRLAGGVREAVRRIAGTSARHAHRSRSAKPCRSWMRRSRGGVDTVLVDNMSTHDIREAVRRAQGSSED